MNSLQVPLPAYRPLYPAHRGCAASVSTVGGGAHSPITIGLPRPSFARSSWWHGFQLGAERRREIRREVRERW